MGTHPIFESDFDCLTERKMSEEVFEKKLLEKVDMSDIKLPPNLVVRPLSIADNENGFFELLAQLTKVGEISVEEYEARFNQMKNSKCYFVLVVADEEQNGKIIGTATLILEQKFIRQCALKGRVEEVVVDESARGTGLGKYLVLACTRLSKQLGVYKTTLECAPHNVKFYEKAGYSDAGEKYMQIRF